jgi:hypothetical protein
MTDIKIKRRLNRGGLFSSGEVDFEITVDGYNGTNDELKKLLYDIREYFKYWLGSEI